MVKPDTVDILDVTGGEQPDTSYILLPGWQRLRNLWILNTKKPRSRPHLVPVTQAYDDTRGLLYDGDNVLKYVADGFLSVPTEPLATITGSSPVRFDAHRTHTVITTGGNPLLYRHDGTYVALPQTNVKCLATFQGAQKLRMVYVKTDDLHRVYFTTIGDLTDDGTVIIDPNGNGDDEWTEGFSVLNFPYEIVDLKELNEGIFLFTRRGIYTIGVGYDDNGFRPKISDRIINIEVCDTPVRSDEGRLWCCSPDGVKVVFYDQGYPTFTTADMEGIENTIAPSDDSFISIDKLRGLVFFCPDSTQGITYVFHLAHKIWTTWDVMIKDAISIRGTTYVVLVNGDYIYELDDDYDNDADTIDVEFRSGLTPIPSDSAEARKRLRYATLKYRKSGNLWFYTESQGGKPFDSVDQVWTPTTQERELRVYLGDQDELFALSFNFRVSGFIVLDEFIVDFLLKRPRLVG